MNRIHSRLEILSQGEMDLIHRNTLKILADIGLSVPNRRVLEMLREHGAEVDFEKEIAKFPEPVMEKFCAGLRRLGENHGEEVKIHRAQGGISSQIYVVDYTTGERRPGTMDDIKKGVALVNHLKNFEPGFAVAVPSDIPRAMTDVATFHYLYSHVKEGGCTFILSPESAKYILAMNKIMGCTSGYLLETVAPLQYRRESLEIALMFAEAGEGLALCPMVMSGATGPVTIAGTITLNNAEVLASLFVNSVLTGKPCTWYGHGTHSMDMRSTICSFGSANQAIFAVATTQMARYYGIYGGNNCALSDAITADYQCGMEKAVTLTMSILTGGAAFGGQGIVGADQGFSFEQLVLDDEWLSYLNYVLDGCIVNEETIAYDVIKSVGIGGNFLQEEHTLEHLRDSYLYSNLFRREGWSDLSSENRADGLLRRAHQFVEDHTQGYQDQPVVIEPSKMDALDQVLKEAYQELG